LYGAVNPVSGGRTVSLRPAAPIRRCWAALLLALLLAACLGPRPGSQGGAPLAAPDAQFDRLFQAPRGAGWTGGDGTLSVDLGGGRSLWLFGDSFLGGVTPAGRRRPDSDFVHNCLVLQQDAHLTTLVTASAGRPRAFFRPEAPEAWYWPGAGIRQGAKVYVLLHRFRREGEGIWGWRWTGTDLARLRLPDLRLETIRPAPAGHGVRYGAALLALADGVYIYGVAPGGAGTRQLYLARAPTGRLEDPWQYATARGWSTAPDDAAALLDGVDSQFGVVAGADGLLLFTMDARQPFDPHLVAYRAARPAGPWQGPWPVYTAPEADRAVAAYNAAAHPQFTVDGRLLVSYNLNHVFDPDALYDDAALYRPRFIRVDLQRLRERLAAPPP
jgi:hypothetical protein